MDNRGNSSDGFPEVLPPLVLLLILLIPALIRWRLLDIPLDRDEGGYAYGAQWMLEGGRVYESFYTMRYPAIFGAYALILAVFGHTAWAVHLGLLFVNAGTTAFVYLLGRRLFDRTTGLAAAAYFAILNLGTETEGFSANSEQFVLLFAMAGLWTLCVAVDRRKLAGFLGAGLLLGMAYLMKQHGALFALAGGAIVLFHEIARRPRNPRGSLVRMFVFCGGVIVPVMLSAAHLYMTGRWDAFRFWTMEYAEAYAGGGSLDEGWTILRTRLPEVIVPMAGIWLFAVAGAVVVWRQPWRQRAVWCVFLLFASAAAVSVGFYFRAHYFRLLFPALALLAGVGTIALGRTAGQDRHRSVLAAAVALVVIAYSASYEFPRWFRMSPDQLSRATYGLNPFPEARDIAKYLRQHTDSGDALAVIGSEPEIYFYADRKAATGHMYTYELMEQHPYALDMQRAMAAEIESARPAYVVVVYLPASWLIRPESEVYILRWLEGYLAAGYTPVGLVELLPGEESIYRWGDLTDFSETLSPFYITIYERSPKIVTE